MSKEELLNTWNRDRKFSEKLMNAYFNIPKELFIQIKDHSSVFLDKNLLNHFDMHILRPTDMLILLHHLNIKKDDNVLEIGTGSGFQSAIISKIAERVTSVEIIDEIHKRAQENLKKLSIDNVELKKADGGFGYITNSPYDKIISTINFEKVPEIILHQLNDNGILIYPKRNGIATEMIKLTKENNKIKEESIGYFIV